MEDEKVESSEKAESSETLHADSVEFWLLFFFTQLLCSGSLYRMGFVREEWRNLAKLFCFGCFCFCFVDFFLFCSGSVYRIGFVREEWRNLAKALGAYVSNLPRLHFKHVIVVHRNTNTYLLYDRRRSPLAPGMRAKRAL